MALNSSGVSLRNSSIFSLLFLLLLPRPSLLFSLKNCTADFNNQNKMICEDRMLTSVPSDIPTFATALDLSSNDITRITQTDLSGLKILQTLDLTFNSISHIEDGAFQDLSALTELLLFKNELTNLTDNMFKGLYNLLFLDLNSNHIESLSRFALEPLNKLQELSLNGNNLVKLNDITHIVLHCPVLEILDLGDNLFTSFESEYFPFPLMNITELDLSSNPLKKFSIHSDVFPQLEVLHLSFVQTISIIELDILDKSFLKSLTTLYLHETECTSETYRLIFTNVETVENLSFSDIDLSHMKHLLDIACGTLFLQRLDLVKNRNIIISILNDTFLESCTNLTELDLSSNSLTELSESSLRMLTRLTWLDLKSNDLSSVPVAIRNITTLKVLSFEDNHITELHCSDFLNLQSLTELNLQGNKFCRLNSCVFKDLTNLKVLMLQNNYLFQFDDSFGISLPNLVVLNVSENNVEWLQKDVFQNMSSLTDLNLKSQKVANVGNGAFEGLSNLKTLTFSVNYLRTELFAGLEHLESLVVFIREDKKTSELTDYEPMTFQSFHSLQKLTIENDDVFLLLNFSSFQDLDNLRELSLDEAFCFTDDQTFRNTPHLLNLRMINCDQFSQDPEVFKRIPDLQVLDLSQNKINSMDFLLKANLTKLEKLILVNNELMVINETVFEAFPSLKYLDLSENPFVCDCSNAGFIQWAILNKQVHVINGFQYRCSSPFSCNGHFLLNFNVQSCWESTAFLCFISSSALVLVSLLSSFIYHLLRWQLVYGFYLFLAFLYDGKKRRQGCPDSYDAFVSYNVHDEDWVYGELLPELEGQQGWRLCLHHRDFQPGKPIIENITDAIYSSRKTLCVISRHYLQSEWCSREIQMASFRLFDEQKDVLILLFLEEISSNQLSPFYRMKKLVKSRTYLSWTQARSHKGVFWERVHQALQTGNDPADGANPLIDNV